MRKLLRKTCGAFCYYTELVGLLFVGLLLSIILLFCTPVMLIEWLGERLHKCATNYEAEKIHDRS